MKKSHHKLLVSAVLISACCTKVFAQALLDPLLQPQFVNQLPIPPVVDARAGGTFSFDITQFQQNLGLVDPVSKLPLMTTVWGYQGTYPGPTILALSNTPVHVFWNNKLLDNLDRPLPHLLPVDRSIDWALKELPNPSQYGVPVVTHLHGGHTESASDGLPDSWYTPNFAKKGSGFIKGDVEPYTYSNTQPAATLWYHDHTMGITRLNAYAGLAGFYILTDQNERNLQAANQLPAPPFDIGLAIQDKSFTADGQLFYPSLPPAGTTAPNPSILPESFGNMILVNGMVWPVLDVEPRQYRFRIVNASDSRFYNMNLSSGQVIYQIGSDNGFLDAPVPIYGDFLIAPGERKDILIDFSKPTYRGQQIILKNNAKLPYPRGATVDARTTGKVMAFRVSKALSNAYPLTSRPAVLRTTIARLATSLPARKLILFEGSDTFGRIKPMLGTVDQGALGFRDSVTENPALNSTEIWEIYNETVDAHPIHLHQVSMQLLNRQKFSATVDPVTGKPGLIKFTGPARTPELEERGWKDTYLMYPGDVTRVITHFDLPGRYVWHCHILSHEDNEMMRPFHVGTIPQPLLTQKSNLQMNSLPDRTRELENRLFLKAYPNPFNSNLTLELTLDKTAMVTVNLYDVKGSRLLQLHKQQSALGNYQFTVDGNNLENGTYICEIMVDQQRLFRKLILQK